MSFCKYARPLAQALFSENILLAYMKHKAGLWTAPTEDAETLFRDSECVEHRAAPLMQHPLKREGRCFRCVLF